MSETTAQRINREREDLEAEQSGLEAELDGILHALNAEELTEEETLDCRAAFQSIEAALRRNSARFQQLTREERRATRSRRQARTVRAYA